MSGDRVVYNGTEMAAEWPARIEAAQQLREYFIGGTAYARIPYGREEGGPFPEPCHDCGVLRSQYHVELVCDMEECPRCHGQAIGCECPYDRDERSDTAEQPEEGQGIAAVDWRALLKRVEPEIRGCTVFLETAAGRFVALAPEPQADDVVGLVVTWTRDDMSPWATEVPAKELAQSLSALGVNALVQLNRSLESFAGYYVSIRP
jgi:hypothetical protein